MEVSFVLPTTLVVGYAIALVLAVALGWLIARTILVARTLLRQQDLLDLHADAIHHINERVTELTPVKKAKKPPVKRKAPARKKADPAPEPEAPVTALSKGLSAMAFSPSSDDDSMFDETQATRN